MVTTLHGQAGLVVQHCVAKEPKLDHDSVTALSQLMVAVIVVLLDQTLKLRLVNYRTVLVSTSLCLLENRIELMELINFCGFGDLLLLPR